MMTSIHIDVADFPAGDKNDNPFIRLLRRRHNLVLADYPDYLIFTHAGQRFKVYPCTRIYYSQESYRPNWRHCDYAITSVKVDDPRAYHLPFYALWSDPAPLIRQPDTDWSAVCRAKEGFCSFLASYDDRSVRLRTTFFQKLNARKRVDSGGKALNNLNRRIERGHAPKMDFLGRYRWHIAFENADIPGWTTEKFTDAFAARTVPIFWGDITVKEQFNPEAFVDRRDFDSDEACIDHILKVDADEALYLKYLSAPPFRNNKLNKEWDHECLLDFFDRIFSQPPNPIARRRWFWKLTKWRLVRRVKTGKELGTHTAEERYQARMKARDTDRPNGVDAG